jgi:hypothetical protein
MIFQLEQLEKVYVSVGLFTFPNTKESENNVL